MTEQRIRRSTMIGGICFSRVFLTTLVTSAILAATANLTFAKEAKSRQQVEELSPAQKLIYDRPHLKSISQRATLRYSFTRRGETFKKLGLELKDRVTMTVTRLRKNGAKDMSFDFLTGRHRLPFADLENFTANPILMLFLNADLRTQKQVLGGQPNYFRNRIRDALQAKAKIADVTVPTANGPRPAKKITITPYLGDRNRAKFKDYERKVYEFILAPDIPGEVYKLRSYVPGLDKAAKPLAEEILTFSSIEKLKPQGATAPAKAAAAGSKKVQ